MVTDCLNATGCVATPASPGGTVTPNAQRFILCPALVRLGSHGKWGMEGLHLLRRGGGRRVWVKGWALEE